MTSGLIAIRNSSRHRSAFTRISSGPRMVPLPFSHPHHHANKADEMAVPDKVAAQVLADHDRAALIETAIFPKYELPRPVGGAHGTERRPQRGPSMGSPNAPATPTAEIGRLAPAAFCRPAMIRALAAGKAWQSADLRACGKCSVGVCRQERHGALWHVPPELYRGRPPSL